jgi:hypothetical protein
VFGLDQSHFELFPRPVANQFSLFGFRHPKFQSLIGIFVHTIIREHDLGAVFMRVIVDDSSGCCARQGARFRR